MRSFQQNLLVGLALALCGLCAWQWYQQTLQRNAIDTLNQAAYEKAVAIRDYTNSIATLNHQIAQMDAQLTALRGQTRTNEQLLAAQEREILQLRVTGESLTNAITEYRQAVKALNAKLKEAYDGVQKQNDSIKQLVAQRDEFVKKYNDSVRDRNDVVAKYNELAARVRKLQEGGKQQ
jgi:chromosome segregation ATPase